MKMLRASGTAEEKGRNIDACVAIDAHTERLERRVVADLAWRVLRHLAPKRRNHRQGG